MDWREKTSKYLDKILTAFFSFDDDRIRLAIIDIFSVLEDAFKEYLKEKEVSENTGSLLQIVEHHADLLGLDKNESFYLGEFRRIRNHISHTPSSEASKDLIQFFFSLILMCLSRCGIHVVPHLNRLERYNYSLALARVENQREERLKYWTKAWAEKHPDAQRLETILKFNKLDQNFIRFFTGRTIRYSEDPMMGFFSNYILEMLCLAKPDLAKLFYQDAIYEFGSLMFNRHMIDVLESYIEYTSCEITDRGNKFGELYKESLGRNEILTEKNKKEVIKYWAEFLDCIKKQDGI